MTSGNIGVIQPQMMVETQIPKQKRRSQVFKNETMHQNDEAPQLVCFYNINPHLQKLSGLVPGVVVI